MIVFPHAKINLGLNVVRRREDGYHDIESVLLPIPLHDILEAVAAPEIGDGRILYTRSGIAIPGEPDHDLVWKAVESIRSVRSLQGLRLHLHKVIPMGAGLGGGSSDGAYTLLLLNDLLSLGLGQSELLRLASGLGSDCPFFLDDRLKWATGRGDKLTPLKWVLEGCWVLLVNPGIHIGTPEVYSHCVPTGSEVDIPGLLRTKPMNEWQDEIHNLLEPHVLATYPAVAHAKDIIVNAGAVYAAMSGSGSSVFGLFDTIPPDLSWPDDHSSWVFEL